MERRQYEASEIRAEGDGEPVLVGHAAVFDTLSVEMWGFREKIAPGAFAESLKRDDVRALWNHNADKPLGRKSAGTLEVWEDRRGLAMRIKPNMGTTYGQDAVASVRRNDVSQTSFGFNVADDGDEWSLDDEGGIIRKLVEIRITYEVSPVVFPAYRETDVSVEGRSIVYSGTSERYEAASLDLGASSRRRLVEAITRAHTEGRVTERTIVAANKLATIYEDLQQVAELVSKPKARRSLATFRKLADML